MYIDFLPIELEEFWTPAHLLEETMYCRRCLGLPISLVVPTEDAWVLLWPGQLDLAFFAIRSVVLWEISCGQSDMLGSRRFISLECSFL